MNFPPEFEFQKKSFLEILLNLIGMLHRSRLRYILKT